VRQAYNPRKKVLTLTVLQIQKADAVTPSAFILPIEVEVKTARGTKTKLLNVNKRIQTFSIPIDGKPSGIDFDKNLKIPLKLVKILPLRTVQFSK
jgi:hypothetical protein